MRDVYFFQFFFQLIDTKTINYNWHNKNCLKLHFFWLFCVQCYCLNWQLEKHVSHFGKNVFFFNFQGCQTIKFFKNYGISKKSIVKITFNLIPLPICLLICFYLSTERGIKRGKCIFYFRQNVRFWMPASFVRQLLTMPASDVRLRHFPMFDNNEPFVPFWWLRKKVAMGKHSSQEVLLGC